MRAKTLMFIAVFLAVLPAAIAGIPSDYFAFWRFDTANGSNATFTPDETGVHNGTVYNGAINGSAGKFKEAYLFDGSNDYINATNYNITDNITVVAWANTRIINNALHYIVNKQYSSGSGWWMRIDTTNKFHCSVTVGTGGTGNMVQVFSTFVPTANTWYHVACVFNGTHNTMYINGVLNNQTAWSGSKAINPNSYKISIAKYAAGAYYWNGTIDEVIIYNRSLTSTEVLDVYDAYSGFFVNLSSPENEENFTKTKNIKLNFSVSGDFNEYNCSLYVNNVLNQTNSSVQNNTMTSFDLNFSLSGTYLWNVSCAVRSITNYSETRNFTVGKTVYLASDNSAGYASLEACLNAINNTNDGCVLNVSNYSETFTPTDYVFDCGFMGENTIQFNNQQNVTIDFNNSNFQYTCAQATNFIYATSGNTIIKNININSTSGNTYLIRTENGGSEGIDFLNVNITGTCGIGIHFAGTSGGRYLINNSRIPCEIDTYGEVDINDSQIGGTLTLYTNSELNNIKNLESLTISLLGYGNPIYNLTINNVSTITNALTFSPNTHYINVQASNSAFENITDKHAINLADNIYGEHNSNWTIENNTFTNIGNISYTTYYGIGNTQYNYSDINFGNYRALYNAALSGNLQITEENQNVSEYTTGLNNFSLWLIDLTGAGYLPMQLYVEQPNGMTCQQVAIAYTGNAANCYLDQQDFLQANGEGQNYTINTTTATLYGGSNPMFLKWNNITNYDAVSIYAQDADNITIKGNTFNNIYPSIIINATNVYASLNHFYSEAIHIAGGTFCINSEGNFYKETIAPINGDCGPANITVPEENEMKNSIFLITWKKQSSILTVIYEIFIKKIGQTFTLLTSTNTTNYSLDTTVYNDSNYTIKIVPWVNGSRINATNALREFSINNVPQVPVLLTPTSEQIITDRTPFFSWDASQNEEGTVYYNLVADNNGDFSSPEINITTTDTNYTPVSDLYFDDYFWKVNANDTVYVGDYSETRNFTLIKSISCFLPENSVDFNSISKNEKKNTTSGTAIIIENSGNLKLNVSINATNLWAYYSNPNKYYQYMISENETGSFENALNDSWYNISNETVNSIIGLKYEPSNDAARMDIQIEAPENEGAGAKTSTIEIWCEEDE